MKRALCFAAMMACLVTTAAAACQAVEGASTKETAVAKRVCDVFEKSGDATAVEYGDPGLFYIHISEQLYRGMRADKVSAEKLAFNMLGAFRSWGIERPKIFYMWSGKKIATAGYSVFGNEPYLEMAE